MTRSLLGVTALVLLLSVPEPGNAAIKEVLVVSDPPDTSAGVLLLEQAIVDELRHYPTRAALNLDAALTRIAKDPNRDMAQLDALRDNARAQFDNLEPDAALRLYAKVLTKLEKAAVASDDLRSLTDTLAMMSAVYLMLKQDKKARASLEQLLTLAPDYVPDEAVFNPQMMAVFTSVSTKVKSTLGVDCEITTGPSGAAVFFDGRLVGLSPTTLKGVRKGKHYIGAVLKGYERVGKNIELGPKTPHSISVKLSPMSKRDTGTLDLATNAVEGMEASEMPPEAKDLLSLTKADMILLLQVTAGSASIAVYAEGSGRIGKTAAGDLGDLETARRMARELLAPLTRSPPGSKEPTTGTVVAKNTDVNGDKVPATTDGKPAADKHEDAKPGLPPSPPPQDDSGKLTVMLGIYGAAASIAVVGGVFGILSLHDQSEFNKTTTDQVAGKPIASRGRTRALVADILYGTAGLVAATGVIVQFFWNPQSPATSVSPASKSGWSFLIGPGYGSVTKHF